MAKPSPFPGMNPFLEDGERWKNFHNWFLHKLAEQAQPAAEKAGLVVDVERSVYRAEPGGRMYLVGEPDHLVWVRGDDDESTAPPRRSAGTAVAEPQAVHEVVLDPDELEEFRQYYLVIKDGQYGHLLTVVEVLSFANKSGPHVKKYREKRQQFMESFIHFVEIDFIRAGRNAARALFPELPRTPYFIYIARKNELGRHDEGYALRLQDPLPTIGVPTSPDRPDLPFDLQAAFHSAFALTSSARSIDYQHDAVPPPKLKAEERDWLNALLHRES